MTDNRLLDAVDELTKPTRTKLIQDGPHGELVEGRRTITVEQPPLLEQLDTAIRSSMGGASTSGASLAFEGAVLNTGALFAAMKISSQIRDWCNSLKVVPAKNSCTDLRAWYTATLTHPFPPGVEEHRTKTLHGWANQIRTLLDPPREKDLPDACPLCGATEWWDPKTGHRFLRPLVIRYRPGDNMVQDAKGLCRACETVWNVRELAYLIEQGDADEQEQQVS